MENCRYARNYRLKTISLKPWKCLTTGSVPAENKVNIKIKNIIAEGAYVVVEGTCKGNFSVSNSNPSYCDVYRIKDGLIEEITTYIVGVSSNKEIFYKEKEHAGKFIIIQQF